MSPSGSRDELLRSARIAAASPGVREAVREVALTALRSRTLTAAHIAAVAKTIGEGIGSVDVTPIPPVRDTYRGAWLGLEDALDRALHALEVAAREFTQGRARLTAPERDRILAEIAQMEQSLAIGWDNGRRMPDSLRARIATLTGQLGLGVAFEPAPGGDPAAQDAGQVLSSIASAVLRGPVDARRDPGPS